jgi:hypothetical protein
MLPFSHSVIRPTTGSLSGQTRWTAFDAGQIARGFDAGHLHAEADAEIGNLALAGELRRQDLAFRTALAKAAGHQNAVDLFQIGCRVFALEDFRFDPLQLDLDLVGHAAVASASISDL